MNYPSMCKIQPKLFTDPHINYPIDDLNLAFTDYIAQCKTLIVQHRFDLNKDHAERIINANSPFELRPQQSTRCGALLIHGLFDSPFTMRDIGTALQTQGILVRGILLPGHGTVPGALLPVNYQQWLQTVRYGIATLAKEVDTLFLIGYSTGASLALYHILQEPDKIAGAILLAPALKIQSAFAGLARWHNLFSKHWPRGAWLNQDKNEMLDYVRYRSVPLNAVHQTYRLTQILQKSKPIPLPLLFALPQDDQIVCSRTSIRYFQNQPHPKNQLLLYSNDTASAYTDPRITLRHAAYPKLRIHHFSHIALPISPQNLHYGEQGDYCYANRIEKDDSTFYGEFSPMQIRFSEWLVHLKLMQHRYQRLTFNPDFDFLMRRIIQFIETAKR